MIGIQLDPVISQMGQEFFFFLNVSCWANNTYFSIQVDKQS